MAFYDRAKSMYERGEVVRAATILAEGLKREPQQVESLEWLLHLYVKEVPNTGLETEIIRILSLQANGRDLLEIVESELESSQRYDKMKALDNVRRRENLLPDPPAPAARAAAPEPAPAPAAPPRVSSTAAAAATDSPAGEDDWQSFSDPASVEPLRVPVEPPPPVRPGVTPVAGLPRTAATGPTPATSTRPNRALPPIEDTSDTLPDDEEDPAEGAADSPRSTLMMAGLLIAVVLLLAALGMAIVRGSAPAPAESGSGAEGSAAWTGHLSGVRV
jgi:hypothetical protein